MLNFEGIPVSKEISAQMGPAAGLPGVSATQGSAWLRSGGIVLAGTAFVAVCAHLALPLYFTPVPLSLAPFAVLLLGLLLSPRLAMATLTAYLAEGALGLPVFSPAPAVAGFAHLLGPTGGYLLSYPFAAGLIAWLCRRTSRGFVAALLSAAGGSVLILLCGALWLAVLTHTSAQSVMTLAVVPFLPGDALKVAAAAGLAAGWVRWRRTAV